MLQLVVVYCTYFFMLGVKFFNPAEIVLNMVKDPPALATGGAENME